MLIPINNGKVAYNYQHSSNKAEQWRKWAGRPQGCRYHVFMRVRVLVWNAIYVSPKNRIVICVTSYNLLATQTMWMFWLLFLSRKLQMKIVRTDLRMINEKIWRRVHFTLLIPVFFRMQVIRHCKDKARGSEIPKRIALPQPKIIQVISRYKNSKYLNLLMLAYLPCANLHNIHVCPDELICCAWWFPILKPTPHQHLIAWSQEQYCSWLALSSIHDIFLVPTLTTRGYNIALVVLSRLDDAWEPHQLDERRTTMVTRGTSHLNRIQRCEHVADHTRSTTSFFRKLGKKSYNTRLISKNQVKITMSY
jgi:hypothetical protein